MYEIDITQIEKFRVGHATDIEGGTGCTVIICEEGATAGCDIRGASPATRETDLLRPENLVEKINAVNLSGGSAFGLGSADGVMRYLKGRGVGFETGYGIVPIVAGASLFDFSVGEYGKFPDKEMGYTACVDAFVDEDIENGNYGAGTGASIGKYHGIRQMMKSGIGSYALDVDGFRIGAIVAVNALGDIFNEDDRQIAGLLDEDGKSLLSTENEMINHIIDGKKIWNGTNTTLGCIVTNGHFTKAECTRLSQIGHDGIARAIKPSHTSADGDAIFTMASGDVEADFDSAGVLAAYVVQMAIIRGVRSAESVYGIPSYMEINHDR